MTAPAPSPDRWADLRPRILSAMAMVAIGGVALWQGGAMFAALAVLCTGAMMWELARMTRGDGVDASVLLGMLAAGMLVVVLWGPAPWMMAGLAVPAVAGLVTPRRDVVVFAVYALILMLTGFSLVVLRETQGLTPVLWLLAVVIASDILGYFAGRILGGPKFWPKISPKKTWSGTVAGWIGAAAVGAGFWIMGIGTGHILWVSPLIAFAGQMGDIAESSIKRRAGVKDSSGLIPGHGGLMDRFDALAFAAIAMAVLLVFVPFLRASGG